MKIPEINLDKYNLQYSAEFIPFSQSRNKDNENKSLNWRVTVKRGNTVIATNYMQGIGHLPGYKQKWYFGGLTISEHAEKERTIYHGTEKGMIGIKYSNTLGYFLKREKLPPPELKDVIYSFLIDSEVLDYSSFEDWADCFGYDTDSRKAEQIYQDCLKTALMFRHLFKDNEIEELREMFQDY